MKIKKLATILAIILIPQFAAAGTIKSVQILQRQMAKVLQRLEVLESKNGTETYSQNGQFIGHVFSDGKNSESSQVYIEELDAYTGFTRDGKVRGGTDYVYFRGRNCTEPAFITIGNYRSTKLLRKFANRLWIINPVPTRNIVRSKAIATGCNNIDPVEKLTNVAIEVLEIELPFNLPVAMPLSYR